MLELVAGIQEVQRLTRGSLEPDKPVQRRRPPTRGARLAAARRFLTEAAVALTVPAPTRMPSTARDRPQTGPGALGACPPRG